MTLRYEIKRNWLKSYWKTKWKEKVLDKFEIWVVRVFKFLWEHKSRFEKKIWNEMVKHNIYFWITFSIERPTQFYNMIYLFNTMCKFIPKVFNSFSSKVYKEIKKYPKKIPPSKRKMCVKYYSPFPLCYIDCQRLH